MFAQTTAKLAVPDSLLYQSLFQDVLVRKAFADHLHAQGKNDSFVRGSLAREAGLSAIEYNALESIATDFLAAHKAYFLARGAIYQQIKSAGQATDAQKAQLRSLEDAHTASLQAHIDQLKAQFGAERYQALDAFCQRAILPHITYGKGQNK